VPPPNRPPVANGASTSTDEDTRRTGALGNSDPDNDPLTAVALSATSRYGAAIDIDPATGEFYYDPTGVLNWLAQGEPLTDSFQYAVTDGFSTSFATVTVIVIGVNDAPTADDDGGFVAPINRVLSVSPSRGVFRNDTDPDRADQPQLRAAPVPNGFTPRGARYTLRADGSFDYDPTTSADLRAEVAATGTADDSFSYELRDPSGATATATVTIRVTVPRPSGYDYESIATTVDPASYQRRNSPSVTTGTVQFESFGSGVLMNNAGWVAFTGVGVGADGRRYSQLYAYNTQDPNATLVRLMHDVLQPPVPGTEGVNSTAKFGDQVQINDNNQVLASRSLFALVTYGDLLFGVQSTLGLSFLETWDAGTPGAGKTAKLVAMGDGGVTDTFGRLVLLEGAITNPFTGVVEAAPFSGGLLFGGLLGLPFAGGFGGGLGFGAAAGLAGGGGISLPVTLLNPVWGGKWPSTWDTSGTFTTVRPGSGTLNNDDVPQFAFNATTTRTDGKVPNLVTTPNSPIKYLGVGVANDPGSPARIADDGTVVVTNGATAAGRRLIAADHNAGEPPHPRRSRQRVHPGRPVRIHHRRRTDDRVCRAARDQGVRGLRSGRAGRHLGEGGRREPRRAPGPERDVVRCEWQRRVRP